MSIGAISLIIMGACIVLWIIDRLPPALVGMCGCLALVITGVCDLSVAMKGFINDIVYLVIGMDIIGNALFTTGAAQRIGKIAVDLSKDNEKKFLLITCTAAGVMSAFLSNMTVIILLLTIINSVAAVSKNIQMRNIAIPIAISTIFGGACTMIGSTPQLTGQSLLTEMTGAEGFSLFALTPIGVPIFIGYILFAVFIGLPLGKRIWGNREVVLMDSDKMAKSENIVADWDPKKAPIALIIIGLALVCFIFEIFSLGTIAMTAGLLCILTGCISQKEAFKRMNWNVIVWLASCFGLAAGMSASGGTKIVSNYLLTLIGTDVTPFMFFAFMTLASLILTQFIANTTMVLMVLPIALPMAISLGINPAAITMGVIFGSSTSILTPISCGFMGITLSAGYKFTDYFRYAWPIAIIAYVLELILIPVFFPL